MRKFKLLVITIVLGLVSFVFAGCEDVKVESIEFNKDGVITLVKGSQDFEVFANVIGDDSKLIATALPYNAKNRNIVFSIKDTSIAKITNNKIIAISEGVTSLTASTEDGQFPVSLMIRVVSEKLKI